MARHQNVDAVDISVKPLVIIGAGGAGFEALWVVQRINAMVPQSRLSVLGWVDDDPSKVEVMGGIPILGTSDTVSRQYQGRDILFHCAVGSNRHRQRLAELFEARGFEACTLVDPSAVVASTATVSAGCYVGPLSVIAPYAQVGRHVLINSHAGVGHHAIVGDFAQLCPGVRVNGACRIDKGAFIGSNAIVHPGLSVGEGAIVGAGSFVIRSVKPRHSVLGVPARIMSRPAENGPNAQS